QPSTTSCSGSSRASARTAVDLPVPFSPRIRTPPMVGTTAFRIRASFIESWPTIAVKGKTWRSKTTDMLSRIGGVRSPDRRLGGKQRLHELPLLHELVGRLLDPVLRLAVVLETLHDLPVPRVRAQREAELQTLWDDVLAFADHGERVPVAPWRRGHDALHRIEHRVCGGRG